MRKMKYLVLGLVGMAVMGLTGCGGTKVDMTDYVTVEFSGVDGEGKAMCNVDYVKLEQDLAGDDDGQISMEELEALAWITQFEMGVSYELDKDTGLSNGDKVTVTVKYDEDIAKENKVKVTGDKKEFKVEGLNEPIEVDAFSNSIFNTDTGVFLEYSGVAPQANLYIENKCTKEPESLITYKVDKTYDLKNGDEITITAELPKSAAEEGYILKETKKTVKVDGLNSYVSSLSQMKEEDKAELLTKVDRTLLAEDNIDFFTADDKGLDMNNNTTFSNLTYLEDVYEIGAKDVLIIPFSVDTTGTYVWIGNEYIEEGVSKSFTGANGYVVVNGLQVDSEGNLIEDDNIMYEVGNMFETKKQMETEIYDEFGV